MTSRTTHSDLARELRIFAKVLELNTDPLIRDPSQLRCVTDAARILVEQDEQIAELTVALRTAREAKRATVK